MSENSATLRKKYIEEVLGPIPEPQRTIMIKAFDSGIAIGMVAAAEMMYATADETAMSAKFLIEKIEKGKL